MRARGISPDTKNVVDGLTEPAIRIRKYNTKSRPMPLDSGPLQMIGVCSERESHRSLIESILGMSEKSQLSDGVKEELVGEVKDELVDDVKDFNIEEGDGNFPNSIKTEREEDGKCLKQEAMDDFPSIVKTEFDELTSDYGLKGHWTSTIKTEQKNDGSCLKLGSLVLNAGNIARILPGRITATRFFPCHDSRMIVVGNKFGELGFWNADHEAEEGNGVYLYHPHSGQISGISIQRHALTKVLFNWEIL